MKDTEWPNFNSREGLSIVLYAMSYCLLFHCFFFEHYLYYSTTWVLAFALSIVLPCLIEAELSSNLHFSPTYGRFRKKNMIFRISIKFRIYIVVIRLFHFVGHFCTVSAPLPLWAVPTEF